MRKRPFSAPSWALLVLVAATSVRGQEASSPPAGRAWAVGTPIVTYWAGPGYRGTPLREADARQLAEGGWNVAWCGEAELDVVAAHGLRGQLCDPLLSPASLDDPETLRRLDALIERVRSHPALYCYFLVDEPSADRFPGLGRLVAHLRDQDPAHAAYINLFPVGAGNETLGTSGDKIAAYEAYLRGFVETVRPAILSYDHYQFAADRDRDDYFLNLALMRRAALDADRPFLNIVQACTWTPAMRAPTEPEMRYLVHTTLAYGARGISYYVYSYPGHAPGIATADGQPTEVYRWLAPLNRDFAAIAAQLQPLRSLAVQHAGMQPPGAEPLAADAPFRFDPPVPDAAFQPGERVRGVLVGTFGPAGPAGATATTTHAVIVNLDTRDGRAVTLLGPGPLERFDPAAPAPGPPRPDPASSSTSPPAAGRSSASGPGFPALPGVIQSIHET